MLDPWIIDEILRREEERREQERPRVDMPLESPSRYRDSDPRLPVPAPAERGVTVIDI